MTDNHNNQAEVSLAEQVAQWYASPVGQLIAEDIRTEYRRQVEDAFGYHAVILGLAGRSLQLTSQARIGYHVVADEPEGGALRLRGQLQRPTSQTKDNSMVAEGVFNLTAVFSTNVLSDQLSYRRGIPLSDLLGK